MYLLYIIERKTWSDFFGSIRDGRYRTQKVVLYKKATLLRLPTYNIIYLFEKNITHPTELNNRMLEGAKTHLVQRDKMECYETESMSQTLYRLCLTLISLQEFQKWTILNLPELKSLQEANLYDPETEKMIELTEEENLILTEEEVEQIDEKKLIEQKEMNAKERERPHVLEKEKVANTLATGRKKNRTAEDQFIIDIRNRKVAGPKIAQALQKHFSTIFEVDAYIKNNRKKAEKFIASIFLEGNRQTIGPKRAKRFCASFL